MDVHGYPVCAVLPRGVSVEARSITSVTFDAGEVRGVGDPVGDGAYYRAAVVRILCANVGVAGLDKFTRLDAANEVSTECGASSPVVAM